MKVKKTTDNHLAIFRREVEKWIAIFGLLDWEVHFIRDDIGDKRAQLRTNTYNRNCVFVLCSEWTDAICPLNSAQIRYIARHEVLELLLADLDYAATCRYVQPEEIETARHVVIGYLMNYIDAKEK